MATIISSQRYIDDQIVAEKLAAEDFVVTLSPSFAYADGQFQVVLDGHHSLAAARLAGVSPEYIEANRSTNDTVSYIDRGQIEEFLLVACIENEYYDIATGKEPW